MSLRLKVILLNVNLQNVILLNIILLRIILLNVTVLNVILLNVSLIKASHPNDFLSNAICWMSLGWMPSCALSFYWMSFCWNFADRHASKCHSDESTLSRMFNVIMLSIILLTVNRLIVILTNGTGSYSQVIFEMLPFLQITWPQAANQ